MTYADEAIGVARAAAAVDLPAVISFTVETDGRLPSGQTLGDAIAQVDDACRVVPAYYMVNCAHPTHFSRDFDAAAAPWLARVHGVRANASRLSHAELDAATELDRGDIAELGALYASLSSTIDLRVVGGCCGTDHEHVATIARARQHTGRRPMSRVFEPFVVSEGEGPTVVLVHGSWTDHRTWALVVPHLSDSYRVVRYDRRGHSRSPWAEPVPRRQDEDDLAALIEELGAPVAPRRQLLRRLDLPRAHRSPARARGQRRRARAAAARCRPPGHAAARSSATSSSTRSTRWPPRSATAGPRWPPAGSSRRWPSDPAPGRCCRRR